MPIVDLAVVLLLILFNGFLALSEFAVVSARRPRLKAMAEAGQRGAKTACAKPRSRGGSSPGCRSASR